MGLMPSTSWVDNRLDNLLEANSGARSTIELKVTQCFHYVHNSKLSCTLHGVGATQTSLDGVQ